MTTEFSAAPYPPKKWREMPDAPILVQKFGGTSVATPERRLQVVEHSRRAREAGYRVAIVVSAMGRRGDPYATDSLLDLLRLDGGAVAPRDYGPQTTTDKHRRTRARLVIIVVIYTAAMMLVSAFSSQDSMAGSAADVET